MFVSDLRSLIEMRSLYRDKLRLEDADLQVVSWDEIVSKLVELQQSTRFCIVKDQLTAHDVANRIMRKENFLVALVNRGLLPVQPRPYLPSLMTKTLEWNLYVTILDAMFDKQFRIRQSFTLDVGALQRRFLVCGIGNLLLAPFFTLFILIFLLLKHADDFRRRPATSALGRDYSRHSQWVMREFNELPHVFESRLASSQTDANAFVRQFPSPFTKLVARFVTFVVSSISAMLLLLSIMNEKFLIHYRLGGTAISDTGLNLFSLIALCSAVLAVSRSFDGLMGEAGGAHHSIQPDALLQAVATHTHYMPVHWRGRGHTMNVYVEFCSLYQYRVVLLLQEVMGALTAPLVMILLLPQRAAEILEFVRSFTVYVDGVGHVCSYALFDFERHGDARYGAPQSGPLELRSRDGKMEKAYLNFRAQHPSWRDERGEEMLHKIAGAPEAALIGGHSAVAAALASAGDASADAVASGAGAAADSVGAAAVAAAPAVAQSVGASGGDDAAAVEGAEGGGGAACGGTAGEAGEGATETVAMPSAGQPLGVALPLAAGGGIHANHSVQHSVRFAPSSLHGRLGAAGTSTTMGGTVTTLGQTIGLGGTTLMGGTMAGGVSALGASGLQLLTGASQLHTSWHPAALSHLHGSAHMQHPHLLHAAGSGGGLGGVSSQPLASSVSSIAAPSPHPLYSPYSPNFAAAAAAMSSEVRTQQLTAGLYSQLDQFYTRVGAHGADQEHAVHAGDPEAANGGMHSVHLGSQQLGRGDAGAGGATMRGRLPPLVGTDQGDYELAPSEQSGYEMRNVAAAPPPSAPPPPPNGYAPLAGGPS